MSAPVLSPDVFAILSALIEERSGLHYERKDRALLADKVHGRMLEAGFDSFLDYYHFLKYDDPQRREMDALVDALVVGETYLFRELEPLRNVLATFVIPRAAAGERLRIWSAACATGEEPFTIGMILAEAGVLENVELCASDISARALARARSGRLGRRALRQPAPEALVRRFLKVTPEGLQVAPELVEHVRWSRVNLCEVDQIAALGTFDAIVCRNVLIYFSDATVRRVVEAIGRALRPRGVLLVGAAESLLRLGTSLVCEEHGGTFCYRRALS